MFEPSAGDERMLAEQGLDHRLVGVALVAAVIDHALALETRRVLGEATVAVDGKGNGGVDAAPLELGGMRDKHIEVFAPVAGRGGDEAGAVLGGDVITGEQGNTEAIAHGA